jgi:hypothetical protein
MGLLKPNFTLFVRPGQSSHVRLVAGEDGGRPPCRRFLFLPPAGRPRRGGLCALPYRKWKHFRQCVVATVGHRPGRKKTVMRTLLPGGGV